MEAALSGLDFFNESGKHKNMYNFNKYRVTLHLFTNLLCTAKAFSQTHDQI